MCNRPTEARVLVHTLVRHLHPAVAVVGLAQVLAHTASDRVFRHLVLRYLLCQDRRVIPVQQTALRHLYGDRR